MPKRSHSKAGGKNSSLQSLAQHQSATSCDRSFSGGGQGGSPNQHPWSLSHDSFMALGFGPWLLVSIDKSLDGTRFIIKASGAGGLALWPHNSTRFSHVPVKLRSCWPPGCGPGKPVEEGEL